MCYGKARYFGDQRVHVEEMGKLGDPDQPGEPKAIGIRSDIARSHGEIKMVNERALIFPDRRGDVPGYSDVAYVAIGGSIIRATEGCTNDVFTTKTHT